MRALRVKITRSCGLNCHYMFVYTISCDLGHGYWPNLYHGWYKVIEYTRTKPNTEDVSDLEIYFFVHFLFRSYKFLIKHIYIFIFNMVLIFHVGYLRRTVGMWGAHDVLWECGKLTSHCGDEGRRDRCVLWRCGHCVRGVNPLAAASGE